MIHTLLASGLLEDLGINLKVLGTMVIIFIVTFLLLSRLLFGRVFTFMKQREEETRKAVEETERKKAEVGRLAAEIEQRIAQVDKEAYDRLQATIHEAIAERQRIVANALQEAQNFVKESRIAVHQARDQARKELRREVIGLSIAAAEKILERPLDRNRYASMVEAGL